MNYTWIIEIEKFKAVFSKETCVSESWRIPGMLNHGKFTLTTQPGHPESNSVVITGHKVPVVSGIKIKINEMPGHFQLGKN